MESTSCSQRARDIIQQLEQQTGCMHVRLNINEKRKAEIHESKIGGLPYWPDNHALPCDHAGRPMAMLMQINCKQAGFKSPLPDCGMLQWFISIDRELTYGCNGNIGDNENFKVVYHSRIDPSVATQLNNSTNFIPTHETVPEGIFPVKREAAIDFIAERTLIGVTDGQFNYIFNQIVKDITGVIPQVPWYEYLDNDDCLYFEQQLGMKPPYHQMLGYPVFSQEDPRNSDKRMHEKVLLIQLASQFSDLDGQELIMWGDMGAGYLFINPKDMLAKDFSRISYCWDCG